MIGNNPLTLSNQINLLTTSPGQTPPTLPSNPNNSWNLPIPFPNINLPSLPKPYIFDPQQQPFNPLFTNPFEFVPDKYKGAVQGIGFYAAFVLLGLILLMGGLALIIWPVAEKPTKTYIKKYIPIPEKG